MDRYVTREPCDIPDYSGLQQLPAYSGNMVHLGIPMMEGGAYAESGYGRGGGYVQYGDYGAAGGGGVGFPYGDHGAAGGDGGGVVPPPYGDYGAAGGGGGGGGVGSSYGGGVGSSYGGGGGGVVAPPYGDYGAAGGGGGGVGSSYGGGGGGVVAPPYGDYGAAGGGGGGGAGSPYGGGGYRAGPPEYRPPSHAAVYGLTGAPLRTVSTARAPPAAPRRPPAPAAARYSPYPTAAASEAWRPETPHRPAASAASAASAAAAAAAAPDASSDRRQPTSSGAHLRSFQTFPPDALPPPPAGRSQPAASAQPVAGGTRAAVSAPGPPAGPSAAGPPDSSRTDRLKELQRSNVGVRVFAGPVEKVLKWHKLAQELGIICYFEVVARVVNVRAGPGCARIVLIRDAGGPVLQVVYYEIDFRLPELSVDTAVRVVGKMEHGAACRLQAYSVRRASGDDVAALTRHAGVAAHHLAALRRMRVSRDAASD